MSLSLNNPLIIGDINKKTKEDISQIKQDIGDLSQLDTADKSSLVNAINDALDSTLNGASRDLDNLSDAGNDKLLSLNAYANEGELLTDAEGLAFVKNYAHSTFDLSKFIVVANGSVVSNPTVPYRNAGFNITSDGIISGFNDKYHLRVDNSIVSALESGSWKVYFKGKMPSVNNRYFCICNNSTQYQTPRLAIGVINANNGFYLKFKDVDLVNHAIGLNVVSDHYNEEYIGYASYDGIETYTLALSFDNGATWISDTMTTSATVYFGSDPLEVATTTNNATDRTTAEFDLKKFYIISNGKLIFSGNKTGIDTIKPDDYTVVGSPTISADGIASGFANGVIKVTNVNYTGNIVVEMIYTHQTCVASYPYILNSDHIGLKCLLVGSSNAITLNNGNGDKVLTSGQRYHLKIVTDSSTYSKLYVDGDLVSTLTLNSTQTATYLVLGNALTPNINNFLSGSIDLNAFKIYVDGDLVYQPCLKIPFTESKTGSKIVDSIYRDRVNDMASQFGYANYYTLDESVGNFTLPVGELYGLIGQQTLRKSDINGINRTFLYSNRTQILTGSCTSGVEVQLRDAFADDNYMLSVPYSAKSATAFTPTQTGDWFAIGEGIL